MFNFEIKFSVTQESVTLLNVLVFEAVSYVIYKEESLPGQKNLFLFKKVNIKNCSDESVF